ncbi:hypothetical protein AN639_04385 [Candidatus Epulonipiscium fishelsonii]|nr:hypothetical protein AN639_04385 [Epulopiscium sp. SCG-B05WGA-EpuloA1]
MCQAIVLWEIWRKNTWCHCGGLNHEKIILIIDDDQNIAELLSLYLKRRGYETKEVYSGIAGIEAFNSYNPNLSPFDLMLPIGRIYDVCKDIRNQQSARNNVNSKRGCI